MEVEEEEEVVVVEEEEVEEVEEVAAAGAEAERCRALAEPTSPQSGRETGRGRGSGPEDRLGGRWEDPWVGVVCWLCVCRL